MSALSTLHASVHATYSSRKLPWTYDESNGRWRQGRRMVDVCLTDDRRTGRRNGHRQRMQQNWVTWQTAPHIQAAGWLRRDGTGLRLVGWTGQTSSDGKNRRSTDASVTPSSWERLIIHDWTICNGGLSSATARRRCKDVRKKRIRLRPSADIRRKFSERSAVEERPGPGEVRTDKQDFSIVGDSHIGGRRTGPWLHREVPEHSVIGRPDSGKVWTDEKNFSVVGNGHVARGRRAVGCFRRRKVNQNFVFLVTRLLGPRWQTAAGRSCRSLLRDCIDRRLRWQH